MPKFKVGDMVEIVETDYQSPELQVGKVGTVTNAWPGCGVEVIMDEPKWALSYVNWFFYDHQLKLL